MRDKLFLYDERSNGETIYRVTHELESATDVSGIGLDQKVEAFKQFLWACNEEFGDLVIVPCERNV